MSRLTSIEDLRELRSMLRHDVDGAKPCMVMCAGTACNASGSNKTVEAVKKYIIEKGLIDRIRIKVTGCHGFCEMGPFILVQPQNAFYTQVNFSDIPRIVDAVLSGYYVEDLLYRDGASGVIHHDRDEIPFFKHQERTILGMNQNIDPTRIYDYVLHGGYEALEKVLGREEPSWVIEEVKRSGLRGRGGGGFPTGRKWEMLAKTPGENGKYLVCNADEGDPGAYMDRSILEGNPQSIIEGMIIGAYGTGATAGVVYVRNEYPIAIMHLSTALRQAREHGLLGHNILGTGFSFDVEIVKGAGAFVCGEETALIRSVEGWMGEPRQRPPYPIERGVHGRPTAINNVETWANIPVIIRRGAEEFAEVGTKNNSGTKIFSLVGKIRNTGLVEVPMGIKIKNVVYDIGGGPVGKAGIKAVQTGGPSGGCIPAGMFDLPVDYDSLSKAGSIMGSGGMIVMDENTCMVDVAKYFMAFLKDESCGKCFVCRKGTQRMYEILDDISKGKGTLGHLDLLEELALTVKDASMCGLGQTASNPVLSTLRYFRNEYERHVVDKKCDAYVCKDLVGAPCQSACPLDTEPWRYIALIEKEENEQAYKVIRRSNPFPSICARVCDRKCEQRCNLGVSGGEPISIRALKRFVADRVDPSVYETPEAASAPDGSAKIAVVGSGPAGLSAAHHLSLLGHKVTILEAGEGPGGMLISCIPSYRLPREVVRKEVAGILGSNVDVKFGTVLGRDFSIDDLLADGYSAVFLAIGANKSQSLDLDGEHLHGIYSSMEFLKAYNLRGEELAGGHVGVVGGGNSAVDAARTALRQEHVQSVTLFYRRTEREMPAYAEEVDAAIEEGIRLETLVSPLKIRYIEAAKREGVRVETWVTPMKIRSQDGRLVGIQCIRNGLGDVDASGRRRPVPIPGTEFDVSLNTLIVAIGEVPDSEPLVAMGIALDKMGRPIVDPGTLCTSRPAVFAGGDLVTGPNTVVDAVSAGRRAAQAINRYLHGVTTAEPPAVSLPGVYIEPADVSEEEMENATRVEPRSLPVDSRRKNFDEVELVLSVEEAAREARRCLRCDVAFTNSGHAECACGSEKGEKG